MADMKRVFLIHGWEGRPDNHWFPWLSLELRARQFETYAPAMPHPDRPKAAAWAARIRDVVGVPDAETFFVGHSLGCVAILRYLGALPEGAVVGGGVFAAGFLGGLGIPEIEEFSVLPGFAEKARTHAKKFVCIFSDDDELVPLPRSYEFARTLRAKAVLERGKGHFSRGNGVSALPSAFKAIMAMAGSSESAARRAAPEE